MKIATFNANSIRSRIPVICNWIQKEKPDILCVQETKVQDSDFPLEAFSHLPYSIIFKGQKKYNGVAIFSKLQAHNVETILPNNPEPDARFLKAVIGPVTIVNTYIPQGQSPNSDKFQYKLHWFGWLKQYFQKHYSPDDLLLWVGDLNVALNSIDVHDPEKLWGHVCYCKDVQDAIQSVIKWGFKDVFRTLHSESGHYTFWDYRVLNAAKRNIGWRLDYIMSTHSLLEKCTDCRIDVQARLADKPSDHTFLVADFDI